MPLPGRIRRIAKVRDRRARAHCDSFESLAASAIRLFSLAKILNVPLEAML